MSSSFLIYKSQFWLTLSYHLLRILTHIKIWCTIFKWIIAILCLTFCATLFCIASRISLCVMCGGTVLIVLDGNSLALCCSCLAVNFMVDHSLISTESCLSVDLIFNGVCCKIFLYELELSVKIETAVKSSLQ